MPAKKVNCHCSGCNGRLRDAKTAKAHAAKEAAAEQSAAQQAEQYKANREILYQDRSQQRDDTMGTIEDSEPEEDVEMEMGSPSPLRANTRRSNKSPVQYKL